VLVGPEALSGLGPDGLGQFAVLAAALVPTPRQSLGAFYPSLRSLDSDTDLVAVAGYSKQAAG
jgi:hypothetical protein